MLCVFGLTYQWYLLNWSKGCSFLLGSIDYFISAKCVKQFQWLWEMEV